MVHLKYVLVSTLLGLFAPTLAGADELSAARAEVPQAVTRAVIERYPQGKHARFVKQIGHGMTMYSVRLAVAGSATSLCVAPSGGIQLEQQDILPRSLPEPIRRSLVASGFESAKVIAVQRVSREHESFATYDLLIRFHGVEHEVMFDGMGELVLGRHVSTCLGEPGPPATGSV